MSVLTEARLPQVFKDEGAFDRRAYLAQQNIDLVATLRAPELIQRVSLARPTAATRLARVRQSLRDEVDELFAGRPQVAAVLRAMLLGDRSFVDRDESTDFQKTGVFHVLVVAGLHVGALAFALYWVCRKLRLSPMWRAAFTLTVLFAYVAVVEQRAPVLRATVMAAVVVLGGFFFRRLDLLNSAALAALVLLVTRPLALRDSSFQLTFVAIGCIAGLALPWLEKTVQPYARALRGWRDVTRDAAYEPRAIQFRIDVRSLAHWVSSALPQRLGTAAEGLLVGGFSLTLRVWELLVLTLVLQFGMLPLMARDFHRVTLSGPLANLAAVPLTGVVVPLGFLTLACGLIYLSAGKTSCIVACLADSPAFAHRSVVCAFRAVELSDTRASNMAGCDFFRRRCISRRSYALESPPTAKNPLGHRCGFGTKRASGGDLSVWLAVGAGKAGSNDSGCRTG